MWGGPGRERHVQCGLRAAEAAPPKATTTTAASATLAATRDRELVLRMADALLELPAIGARLAPLHALELGARLLELRPRPRVVDLVRAHGVVDERDRAIELD